jgi:hypothetical protein
MNNELEWIRNGGRGLFKAQSRNLPGRTVGNKKNLGEPAEMQTAHLENKRRVATAQTFPVRAHVCISAIYNFCMEHFSTQMRFEKYKSSYSEAGNIGVQVGQSQKINSHVKF